MCSRGASVAAFLQQAEENLAVLSARSSRVDGTPRGNNLGQRLRIATPSHLEASPDRTHATTSAAPSSRHVPSPRRSIGDPMGSALSADVKHLDTQSALGPQTMDVEQLVRRLEQREAEAKDQMDVQAKIMLGVDRKVKSFDGRLRAVEAGVAAAADVASSGSSGSGDLHNIINARLYALEASVMSSAEARYTELEKRVDGLAAAAASRDAASEEAADMGTLSSGAQPVKQLMELQRRAAALAEGARRDREASRQHAKGLVEELRRSLRMQLEDFNQRSLAREETLLAEAQQHAKEVGRDIAADLLRGPISDLVDRRARDAEDKVAISSQRSLSELKRDVADLIRKTEATMDATKQTALHEARESIDDLARNAVRCILTDVVKDVARDATREAIRENCLRELSSDLVSGHADGDGEKTGDALTVGPASPGRLLRQTAARVAELEARGQGEEDTYWTIVQALEIRVAGLEAESDRMQQKLPPDRERSKAGVFQDPAVATRPEHRKNFPTGARSCPPGKTSSTLGAGQVSNRCRLVEPGLPAQPVVLENASPAESSFGVWSSKTQARINKIVGDSGRGSGGGRAEAAKETGEENSKIEAGCGRLEEKVTLSRNSSRRSITSLDDGGMQDEGLRQLGALEPPPRLGSPAPVSSLQAEKREPGGASTTPLPPSPLASSPPQPAAIHRVREGTAVQASRHEYGEVHAADSEQEEDEDDELDFDVDELLEGVPTPSEHEDLGMQAQLDPTQLLRGLDIAKSAEFADAAPQGPSAPVASRASSENNDFGDDDELPLM